MEYRGVNELHQQLKWKYHGDTSCDDKPTERGDVMGNNGLLGWQMGCIRILQRESDVHIWWTNIMTNQLAKQSKGYIHMYTCSTICICIHICIHIYI